MSDPRPPFDVAVAQLRRFLGAQGWPSELRWITRDRLTGHRAGLWIYRPNTLKAESASRAFYEALRRSASSVRLDGLAQLDGHALVYVEDYGGESRSFDLGIRAAAPMLGVVTSPVAWMLLRLVNAIRGGSPFLRHIRIPVSS